MKLYANYQNTKCIFSEVHTTCCSQSSRGAVLWVPWRCTTVFNLVSPRTGLPGALVFIPRCSFRCPMIIPCGISPKAFIFSTLSILNDFVSFSLKKEINYLKTKILFYQSIPAVLKALTSRNAINYVKELFIVSLNIPSIFLGSL